MPSLSKSDSLSTHSLSMSASLSSSASLSTPSPSPSSFSDFQQLHLTFINGLIKGILLQFGMRVNIKNEIKGQSVQFTIVDLNANNYTSPTINPPNNPQSNIHPDILSNTAPKMASNISPSLSSPPIPARPSYAMNLAPPPKKENSDMNL
jgi:hypothetical protein